MLSRRIKGLASEGIACFYLQLHGLQLRTKNFRTKFGEIDIIMTDGDTLVFVEVRLRLTKGWAVLGILLISISKRKSPLAQKHTYPSLAGMEIAGLIWWALDAGGSLFGYVTLSQIHG